MYEYFHESQPGITCSEVTYRRQILSKNIRFCKLGEEECEKNTTDERKSKIKKGLCEVCDD